MMATSDTVTGEATSLAALEILDHQGVNWTKVRSTAYLIHQHFHYEYTGPIRDLRQRLVIIPPEHHGDQRLVTHHLEVSSPTAEIQSDVDAFGNHVISLAVPHVERAIDFVAWIVAERETSARALAITPELHAGAVFREPSPLTKPDAALRDAAASFHSDSDDALGLARRINRRVFEEMRYTAGVTGVRTPAIEAYALRQGVCQDYAHVMLVLCRLSGLPARYVSGHLLGEGGTHAWVEVLLPDPDNDGQFVARAFDPTHGSEPGMNYVTVATGRDYGDVAPTSGTFVAPHQGELSTSKRTGLTSISYFPEG